MHKDTRAFTNTCPHKSTLHDHTPVVLLTNPHTCRLDVVCSALSALVTCSVLNPIDVIRTRLYNQPFGALSPRTPPRTPRAITTINTTITPPSKPRENRIDMRHVFCRHTTHTRTCVCTDKLGRGQYYSSTFDAFRKTVRLEGPAALWKGQGLGFRVRCGCAEMEAYADTAFAFPRRVLATILPYRAAFHFDVYDPWSFTKSLCFRLSSLSIVLLNKKKICRLDL